MLPSPLLVRSVAGGLLVVCGAVVLGISAHVESSTRTFGIRTSTFTYDAFVGAWTVAVELAMLVARATVRHDAGLVSLAVELGLAGLHLVFWLAAGIATTVYTDAGRSLCRNLDDLFEQPELEGLDADALALIKKAMQKACSELHAELAFIWIGFAVLVLVLAHLGGTALRARRAVGGRAAWRASLRSAGRGARDPFSDPVGAAAGPTVGLAGNEDPDGKP
ncbi:hypothetical protein Q5752_005332 [Cryptotrichosporon argae]